MGGSGEHELRFRALAEVAFDGIFVLDGLAIAYANAAGHELFGYLPGELPGKSPLELTAPESRDQVKHAILSGTVLPYEAIGVRKDGSRFPCEIRGRSFELDGRKQRVTAIRDLSERKQAESELAEKAEWLESSVSLLRATLESTVEGIIAVDRAMRIRAYNQRFLTLWRIAEHMMSERDDVLRNFAASQLTDPEQFLAGVLSIYNQPEVETFDVLTFKDGRVLERSSRPQRLGTQVVGRVWSFRDVTASRRIEDERDRLYSEAREAVRLRDEFLSIASHELYTPLCSLTLALQTLRGVPGSAPVLEAQRVRLSAVAERQTERLGRLVDALLDVSRIESGRLELSREVVDLCELAREVAERFAPDLERSGSALTLEVLAPVAGECDRSRLDQVLTNLLANAIKYGGGKPIGMVVRALDGGAELAVRDQGLGIEPAQQGRLFERFARAASVRHFGGLGLGLYIARRAVEAHGGNIALESTLGQGSTFTVWLPLSGKGAA